MSPFGGAFERCNPLQLFKRAEMLAEFQPALSTLVMDLNSWCHAGVKVSRLLQSQPGRRERMWHWASSLPPRNFHTGLPEILQFQ
jgi:hypothetical protein